MNRKPTTRNGRRGLTLLAVLASGLGVHTIARAGTAGPPTFSMTDGTPMAPERAGVAELLASGEAVFGIFSGDKTAEQGALIVQAQEADFILYSLERPPFDLPTMMAYMDGMARGARRVGVEPQSVLLRIPPIEDADVARDQVERGLGAGAGGIVFPHVATAEQAATSIRVMPEIWPVDPNSTLVDVLIVEDIEGVENVRQIMSTPGLSVVFAGPGDLRRAFEDDMEQVERAIQTILAACLEFDVPCGVTAGPHDIEERLDQGFRVIIISANDNGARDQALALGRAAAGR